MSNRHKLWKSCEECGIKTKNIRIFKGKYLCYKCYRKSFTSMRISGMGLTFNEPLNRQLIFTTCLTENQNDLLIKRLKYLYPYKLEKKSNKIIKRAGISEYVRGLILADIEMWDMINKEKIRKESIKNII